jgi:hypothetical protein
VHRLEVPEHVQKVLGPGAPSVCNILVPSLVPDAKHVGEADVRLTRPDIEDVKGKASLLSVGPCLAKAAAVTKQQQQQQGPPVQNKSAKGGADAAVRVKKAVSNTHLLK